MAEGINIDTPWGKAIDKIGDLIGKVVPDVAAQQAAKARLAELQASGQLQEDMAELAAITSAQTDINKVEAANASIFVSGWRPYVGWICGTGLGIDCIVAPLFTWFTALIGHPTPFPHLNSPFLQYTMGALLGVGHLSRTYEKIKGVAGQH